MDDIFSIFLSLLGFVSLTVYTTFWNFFEYWARDKTRKERPMDFQSLPPELRHMVYSKMKISERAQLARTLSEAYHFFKHHPVKVQGVFLRVEETDGVAYMNVYYDHIYEERHRLSKKMKRVLSTELASYASCECAWCMVKGHPDAWRYKWSKDFPERIVHTIDCNSIDSALSTLQIVKAYFMSVMTEPYDGLVDNLQPTVPHLPMKQISFKYHATVDRNSGNMDCEKWTKWIGSITDEKEEKEAAENSGAEQVTVSVPNRKLFTLDKKWFDCDGVRNATLLNAYVSTAIDATQLSLLRATDIFLIPFRLSEQDFVVYFLGKLYAWIHDPHLHISVSFLMGHLEDRVFHCLVEFIMEQMYEEEFGPDIVVHRGWDCYYGTASHPTSLRNIRTNTGLLISEGGLLTVADKDGQTTKGTSNKRRAYWPR